MSAIDIVQIIFQSVAILFMLTFMLIGIWSFIIFIKIYKNQRINNFLLEKINHSILSLTSSRTIDTYDIENDSSSEQIIEDDNIIISDDYTK